MGRIPKIEIQKGAINPNPQTMKQMSFTEKVTEQKQENALRKHGQTLDLHEPKTSRK